jgi:hypothetical protein
MKKSTRLIIGPIAMVALLAILALCVAKREGASVEEATRDTVHSVAKFQQTDREGYAVVGFVVLIALVAFVTWTAFRADKGEDKVVPPTGESNSSGTKAPR